MSRVGLHQTARDGEADAERAEVEEHLRARGLVLVDVRYALAPAIIASEAPAYEVQRRERPLDEVFFDGFGTEPLHRAGRWYAGGGGSMFRHWEVSRCAEHPFRTDADGDIILYSSAPSEPRARPVWTAPWVRLLHDLAALGYLARSEFRAALARGARDKDWCDALATAAALGGRAAVQELALAGAEGEP